MINVTFTEMPRKLALRVEGHAGYAESGKDIICSSASILAYTLASFLDGYPSVDKKVRISAGDTLIECVCADKKTYAKVKDAYDQTMRGYELLAYNYPQYVRLTP